MKIGIIGIGYVGLSLSTLLSQKYEVIAFDIDKDKVEKVNLRISPIKDKYIEKFFKNKTLNLKATSDYKEALNNVDFVIICTPTNYDESTKFFDTKILEDSIKKCIQVCNLKYTTIVIKSTVNIGFTKKIKEKYKIKNIIFSPEFLREGNALYDNLYPSRIIVGDKTKKARVFANLLKEFSLNKNTKILLMNSTEAEAVKLFSNAYLALRISFFNELDTYCELKNLNTKDIINGICLDPRIGDYYNNPSFGYGGYCLPKDTKQLLANYNDISQIIIKSIIESNIIRKEHIVNTILKMKPKVVGIYRITMKNDSDDYRQSAIIDIIYKLSNNGIKVIIYEPLINRKDYSGFEIIKDLNKFKQNSDVILANRFNDELLDCMNKVYSRDIFRNN